jgi:SPP1 gp7 family putative phage head morphogenesis protein
VTYGLQTPAPLRANDRVRETRQQRMRWERAKAAENQYAIQLRKVARQVGAIIRGFAPDGVVENLSELNETLNRYARILQPWARSVAAKMLTEVSRNNERAWASLSKEMSRELQMEIRSAPTGETLRQLQAEQIHYITSLPLEASQRVHELTMRGLSDATRAPEIQKEIMRSGHVTESRATLIARTEVGRASTNLTQARALHVDSPGYIWRTSHDADVRPSHRKMEGKFVAWDEPPTLDNLTGHAGALPNCRCRPEPVIPDKFN